MKSLLYGIAVIVLVAIGGLVYRNAVEHPAVAIACPVPTFECPDGTQVAHLVGSCAFPACPAPNVSLPDAGIAFAIPDGFGATSTPDTSSIVAYAGTTTDTQSGMIIIRRFTINASSTALATIRQTAISSTSGEPVPITAFTSAVIGRSNPFTVVTLERSEGVIDTAYYLSRGSDVLRFDAIDQQVTDWTSPTLDTSTLPANKALRKLLSTLE
ncbi:MAG: hypothetical protein RLZZ26_451 [Candidatus Parcubacteria bacterium]|jgi:hypothetical protein